MKGKILLTVEKLNSITIPFNFESSLNEDIHRRLVLISPSAAQYFKDACKLMDEKSNLESTVNLVAHMLRETESLLREVLLPIPSDPLRKKRKRKNQHLWEIENVLKSLKFKKKDLVWIKWEDISRQQYKYAHRNGLWTAEKKDEEFRRYWDNMLLIFDKVTAKVESNYSSFFNQVDILLSKQQPTQLDADLLARLPNNSILLGYFFEKLDNPMWLGMLIKRHFFEHPPKALIHPDGGISYPSWQQSEYLKKIADNQSCCKEIVKIISDIDTDNARVKAEVIEVLIKLPSSESVKLVEKVGLWTLNLERWILPKTIGSYIHYLGESGSIDEAVSLARKLLSVESKGTVNIGSDTYISSGLKIKIDEWEYQEILNGDILPLADTNGEVIVNFLVDILNSAIDVSKGNKMSTIWQPAIEEHEQNSDSEIKANLTNALRDVCIKAVNNEPKKLKSILKILTKEKKIVFHRIAIYLSNKFTSIAIEEAKKILLNKDYFEDDHYKHEYLDLLRNLFNQLDQASQDQILNWIDMGPDIEKIQKRYNWSKNRPTIKQIARFKEVWKRDRLSFIAEKISKNKKDEYKNLIKRYGEPQHPDFDFYSSGGTISGPNSPYSKEQLEKKTVGEIISLLKSWKPNKSDDEKLISKEGLGRLLTEIIVNKPVEFSGGALDFLDLNPIYIGALLNGFKDLSKNKAHLDWVVVLNLCTKITEMPLVKPVESERPQERWNLNTMAELLDEAIGNDLIPYGLNSQVFKILSFLVNHPHPTKEDEEKYLYNDPVAYSINTVRGDAFNAFIKYIGWVKKNSGKNEFSISNYPEISRILNERLNDESLAIRSIFGSSFVNLFLNDTKWTNSHIDDIFPEDNELIFNAAWEGFICWTRPHRKLYEPLKNKYLHAVKLISELPPKDRPLYNKNQNLVEHLMVYLWEKTISFDDKILNEFYKIAPIELKEHAIHFVGRVISNKGSKFTTTQLARIKELWNKRKEFVKINKNGYSELEGFGYWVISGRFSHRWVIAEALDCYGFGVSLERDSEILEFLKKNTTTFPVSVVKIVNLYIRNDEKGWNYTLNLNNIKEIMLSINSTSNREAKNSVKSIANLLVTKGVMEFRDLAN